MKINALEIDGYGVWTGLRIERISDSLSVIYGANEAGKTTLLQFIRSMLYGFSSTRRRYFPPVHGGTPGGIIDVTGQPGRFEIARHLPADDSGTEEVVLTAPDGTRQGEHIVKLLLANIDEAIFNNVFAVELCEMQELATLGKTQAAELLYNLTAGLDRISLVEVMRELEASRNRILDSGGKSSQVTQLWAQREKLRSEIEELGSLTRRFGQLAAERGQIDGDLVRLEEEKNQAQLQLRAAELALALRDRWLQRKAVRDQLAALGPLPPVPEGEIERLDALNARLNKHQQRIEQLQTRQEAFAAEASDLKINESLHSQAARIEALLEQESWFVSLKTRIGELDAEIADLQNELTAQWQPLGLDEDMASKTMPIISTRSLATLRLPAGALRRCRDELKQAKRELNEADKTAESLTQQIETALSARGEHDLGESMDRRGNLVAQYRRRVQIDERLDQLSRHQSEVEEQSRRLVESQLLPVGVLVGLGAAFILGMALILAGLFMPASITGSMGWVLAVLGLVGGGAAVSGKYLLEKSRASRLDSCQKQLIILQSQQEQAKSEREQLDARLPRGGGPMVSRLEAAEKDLAALEELVPLETRRNSARQQSIAAGTRLAQAKQEHKSARRSWREALTALGLPSGLSVRQARRLFGQWRHLAESQRRLSERREEVQRHRRQWDLLASRIAQTASDAGAALDGTDAMEHFKQLGAALDRQKADVNKRETIHRRIRRLRLRRAKHEEAVSLFKHRRRELFFQAGAEDETDFRRRALQHARAETLLRERNTLDEEIAAAIGNQCSEQSVRRQIEEETAGECAARSMALKERHAVVEDQIGRCMEKRGELTANMQNLVSDRQLPGKQLELAMIEKRLEQAIDRWQVLAAAWEILDQIRSSYESQRQPETLQEASGYLHRLTQGRYRRVWTPLGENVLRVDDAEGRPLPVENLSRGTREQLFLSLRMALAADYAKRGAALPLVLDDVLVNFDADRAAAAAAVLRDFAAAGHQLLVFTCHRHISNIFASLGVPVGHMPGEAATGRTLITFEVIEEKAESEVKRPRNRANNRGRTAHKLKALAEEAELPPEPADRRPPLEKPATKLRPARIIKPKAKTQGVFDADFFDPSENTDKKESEADHDPSSSENDADDDEEYYQSDNENRADAA
ncbi:MAG: AAA family ATPase [Thermoguttaceae bacterium]